MYCPAGTTLLTQLYDSREGRKETGVVTEDAFVL